jgi:hypothetical protein
MHALPNNSSTFALLLSLEFQFLQFVNPLLQATEVIVGHCSVKTLPHTFANNASDARVVWCQKTTSHLCE